MNQYELTWITDFTGNGAIEIVNAVSVEFADGGYAQFYDGGIILTANMEYVVSIRLVPAETETE